MIVCLVLYKCNIKKELSNEKEDVYAKENDDFADRL